ncbi:MAG: hypothetical protein EBU98_02905, partial [Actinobacteria bacterium]|nr:hypothetical protein [Actinomycetota bacterium]
MAQVMPFSTNFGAMVGAGYIGLPTAAGFADVGYDVVCVD